MEIKTRNCIWWIGKRYVILAGRYLRNESIDEMTSQELIKVRGAQVAPAELEALLLEHPSVMDAAVIGIKT